MSSWSRNFWAPQAAPRNKDDFPFVVVGNKIDQDNGESRVVSEYKSRRWCAANGNIPQFETSAKENVNVEAAFDCVARLALKNEPEDEYYPDPVDMHATPTPQKSGFCSC